MFQEDTQVDFDGLPASQLNDEDDLLKPDPKFSYPVSQKRRPKNQPVTFTKKVESKGMWVPVILMFQHFFTFFTINSFLIKLKFP